MKGKKYSYGDESAPIGQFGQVQFFRNDPIYGTFSKFIDTKVVVELLGSGVDSQKAVKIVPSRPRGIVRVHVRFQLSGELGLSTLKPR